MSNLKKQLKESDKEKKTCKVTEISDKYFFDNGYFSLNYENHTVSRYSIIQTSDKWKNLIHQCLQKCQKIVGGKKLIKIITPELLLETLNEESIKHPRPKTYTKITPEEKLRRKLQRKKIRDERKLKNANRITE